MLDDPEMNKSVDVEALEREIKRLRKGYSKMNEEICQTLGKALGYPFYKDDQKNFPGSTHADGVCVGDHVAESLAEEAANKIKQLKAFLVELHSVSGRLIGK